MTAKPAGTDPDSDEVCRHKVFHCITPERDNSAHYFWAVARDYRIDNEEVSQLWEEGTPIVFGQDIDAAEAIERVISAYKPGYPVELNMKVDGGPLRARRIIERMIADEVATATV